MWSCICFSGKWLHGWKRVLLQGTRLMFSFLGTSTILMKRLNPSFHKAIAWSFLHGMICFCSCSMTVLLFGLVASYLTEADAPYHFRLIFPKSGLILWVEGTIAKLQSMFLELCFASYAFNHWGANWHNTQMNLLADNKWPWAEVATYGLTLLVYSICYDRYMLLQGL
jgi:hypothetical protein